MRTTNRVYLDTICPECGEECRVVPRDSAFDYAGTHCTHGCGGTHYPADHGAPESECCGAYIEGAEEIELDYLEDY